MAAVAQIDRYKSYLARCGTRYQGHVVSLSVLSLLSACVRLCQLREVHSLQQALNPWSRTQSAATDGSPACCTSFLMLRVCVMLRVLPLNPPCVHCLCCCCTNSSACPVWPVLLGQHRPWQRRSASDKCSVRCRPIKQRDKFTATFYQNLPSINYILPFFFKKIPQILPSGQFFK